MLERNAWVVCALFATCVFGCGNEGKVNGGDAGGSGGSSGAAGSAGSSGSAGDDGGPPPPPPPSPCTSTDQCDDGIYCNGQETCINRVCAAGVAPSCDDGIACTVDRCIEDRRTCSSLAPDDDVDGHRDATCLDAFGDALGDDCDDTDSTRYPGALEVCDADDHDEDCDLSTFGRVDFDGDTYANANCCNIQLDDTLLCGDDCDDANARVHPGNTESCDGLDNDCNGLLDHPLEDQDGDGFATSACGGTDCDDFSELTYAGAMERCDGFDNDCLQGGGVAADETDLDADSFVTGVCMRMDDMELAPGDCDEDRRSANPMRTEQCNGKDDDCDGATDEALDCTGAVKQVDTGYLQTCSVRVNGTVACWGRNDDGTLGTGSDAWVLDYPRDVIDPRSSNLLLSQVRQVSVGSYHTCATHLDGRISCWGNNVWGALGYGSTEYGVMLPVAVVDIEDAEEVCSGNGFSCTRRRDGSVWCWGAGFNGQLGNDATDDHATPVLVPGLDASIDLDCDGYFACSVDIGGRAQCWGDNRHGQLGDITLEQRNHPVQVFGVEDAVHVTTGRSHACAQLRNGTAMCWGDNTVGQIGNGNEGGNVLRATEVVLYTGYVLDNVVDLAAGGGDGYFDTLLDDTGNTCARLRGGEVLCWGLNHRGQLGYGEWGDFAVTPARLASPRYPVQMLPDAIDLSIAHQHGCAIAPDGTLRCWGGGEGQLPDLGSTPTPIVIEGL